MIRREGETHLPFPRVETGGVFTDEAVECDHGRDRFAWCRSIYCRGRFTGPRSCGVAPDDHVLVFTIHHAVSDGWTLGVFIRGFLPRVRAGTHGRCAIPCPRCRLTYSAWGAAERAYWQPAEFQKRLGFWRSELASTVRMWDDREGPATATGPARRWVQYFYAETHGCCAGTRADRRGHAVQHAADGPTKLRFTNGRGTRTSSSARRLPTAPRRTCGRSWVPFRASCRSARGSIPGASFADNLRAVHQKTLESTANAIAFRRTRRRDGRLVSTPGHNPIYEVRFALQNHPVPDVTLHGLSARLTMRSSGTSRFHLACEITIVPAGLLVAWLFRTEVFPPEEIADLHRLYAAVLETACHSPDTRVAQFAF